MSLKGAYQELKKLLQSKQYAAAIELATENLKQNPSDPNLLLAIASSYHGIGSFDLVSKYCNQVLSVDPSNQSAYNGLINAYESSKRWAECISTIQDFTRLLRSASDFGAYLKYSLKLVDVYQASRQFPGAVDTVLSLIANTDWSCCEGTASLVSKRSLLLQAERIYESGETEHLKQLVEAKKKSLDAPKTLPLLIASVEDRYYATSKLHLILRWQLDQTDLGQRLGVLERLIDRICLVLEKCPSLSEAERNSLAGELEGYCREAKGKSQKSDAVYFDLFTSQLISGYGSLTSGKNEFTGNSICHSLQDLFERLQNRLDFLEDTAFISDYYLLIERVERRNRTFGSELGPSVEFLLRLLRAAVLFFEESFDECLGLIQSSLSSIFAQEVVQIAIIYSRLLDKKSSLAEAEQFLDQLGHSGSDSLHLERAWVAFQRGDFPKSQEILFSLKSNTFRRSYQLGRLQLAEGMVADSLQSLRDSVHRYPKFAPAHRWIGECYVSLGDLYNAKKYFAEAIKLSAGDESVLGRFVYILFSRNEHSEAIPVLSAFFLGNPRSAFTLRNLTLACYYTEDVAGCIIRANQYLRINFRDPEIWELVGECYLREERLNTALRAFEHALEMDPSLPFARLGVASIKIRVQQFDEAILSLVQLNSSPLVGHTAIDLLAKAIVARAQQLIGQARFGEAFEGLFQVVSQLGHRFFEMNSDHYAVWWLFFRSLHLAEQYPGSAEKFIALAKEIAQNKNLTAELCAEKMISLCNRDNLPQALHDAGIVLQEETLLKRAVSLCSNSASNWNDLAVQFAIDRKFSLAQHCFIKAIQQSGDNLAEVWVNLGFLYLHLADSVAGSRHLADLSMRCMQEAQRVDPRSYLPWLGQYVCCGADEALTHAAELGNDDQFDDRLQLFLGSFYLEKHSINDNMVVKAICSLQQVLQRHPDHCTALVLLACAYERIGRMELARQAIVKAADLSPSSSGVVANLLRICGSDPRNGGDCFDRAFSGVAMLKSGDISECLEIFAELSSSLSKLPTSDSVILQRLFIRVLYSAGKRDLAFEQSLQCLDQCNRDGSKGETVTSFKSAILLAFHLDRQEDLLSLLLEASDLDLLEDLALAVEFRKFLSLVYREIGPDYTAENVRLLQSALLLGGSLENCSGLWSLVEGSVSVPIKLIVGWGPRESASFLWSQQASVAMAQILLLRFPNDGLNWKRLQSTSKSPAHQPTEGEIPQLEKLSLQLNSVDLNFELSLLFCSGPAGAIVNLLQRQKTFSDLSFGCALCMWQRISAEITSYRAAISSSIGSSRTFAFLKAFDTSAIDPAAGIKSITSYAKRVAGRHTGATLTAIASIQWFNQRDATAALKTLDRLEEPLPVARQLRSLIESSGAVRE